jgi:large subunit ribosomal protein L10
LGNNTNLCALARDRWCRKVLKETSASAGRYFTPGISVEDARVFYWRIEMPMSRAQKVERVATIRDQLSAVEAIFLTEYRGLTVQEMQQVRRSLREDDARMRVMKMSLTGRAAMELGYEDVSEHLQGPTALVFAEGDPLVAAKSVREQSRQHRRLVLKGGIMDGKFVGTDQVAEFALLGSRSQLMAKVAGGFSGPINKAAGLFASFTRSAVGAFTQLLERKEAAESA